MTPSSLYLAVVCSEGASLSAQPYSSTASEMSVIRPVLGKEARGRVALVELHEVGSRVGVEHLARGLLDLLEGLLLELDRRAGLLFEDLDGLGPGLAHRAVGAFVVPELERVADSPPASAEPPAQPASARPAIVSELTSAIPRLVLVRMVRAIGGIPFLVTRVGRDSVVDGVRLCRSASMRRTRNGIGGAASQRCRASRDGGADGERGGDRSVRRVDGRDEPEARLGAVVAEAADREIDGEVAGCLGHERDRVERGRERRSCRTTPRPRRSRRRRAPSARARPVRRARPRAPLRCSAARARWHRRRAAAPTARRVAERLVRFVAGGAEVVREPALLGTALERGPHPRREVRLLVAHVRAGR